MDEGARHGGHDAGPPGCHEDVGDVHVEGWHEAVEEGEPELAYAPTIVNAREPVDDLMEGDAREEEELHEQDAAQRAAPEAREDVVQLAHEGHRGDAPDDAERQAEDGRSASEQDHAAP